MKSKKRLGRGLEALISESLAGPEVVFLPLDRIDPNPRQPRVNPDEGLESLTESITKHGVLQPILVRENGERYELVAGERRWRAAGFAGLARIPAIIVDADDPESLELALVENLQRKDLNPVEEARAILHLHEDFGMTHDDIARIIGADRTTVTNKIRLLSLSEPVLRLLEGGLITEGHARVLLRIDDPEKQSEAASLIVQKGLTVREAENLIASERRRRPKPREPLPEERRYESAFVALGAIKAKVRFGRKRITVAVEFRTAEEIDRFLSKIKEAME
ncbi:MAG: ParB/RepB/Spo0J family partition protein [candidate division WOR-3 bacterium]